MIKNRIVQIIFQTAFVTIGIIGIIASIGFFDYSFRSDFFVHFTNLSNYLCIGIVLAELIQTVKKEKDDYVTVLPKLKFIGVLAILLTFIVFNFLLAPTRDTYLNFKVNSITFHVILPIMFILDWVLFYERGKVKWYLPLLSTIFPLIYVTFVYIRAWFLGFNPETPYIYPYFFLNLDTQGVVGVIKWVLILLIAFIVIGYIFFGIDRLLKMQKNKKLLK